MAYKKSKKSNKPRVDVYAAVTDKIVEALEAGASGDKWRAPWHAARGAGFDLPVNVASKKTYRGVNTWVLIAESFLKGYQSPVWGTYNQWLKKVKNDDGTETVVRHVRKGEEGTTVILWKPTKRTVKDAVTGEESEKGSLLARSFIVFNAEQVEGYEAPVVEPVEPGKEFDAIEHAEEFFNEIGAVVHHGGARAFYAIAVDRIQLPEKEAFEDNVSYYATSAHEHVHWTGHKSRLNREFGERFGNEAYAFEELVAELGAAYVCGILGLDNEPRADHAQYLASWLKVLKADPKAIVTAASKAQRAADFLVDTAGESAAVADEENVVVDDDVELERSAA